MAAKTQTRNSGTPANSELAGLTVANNKEVASLEHRKKALHTEYKEQEQFTVQGAPMYRAYFGNTMVIQINGISVCVPLDGGRYSIPETFAKVFNQRISSVNEQLDLQNKLSNAQKNLEQYPGELDLIKRV